MPHRPEKICPPSRRWRAQQNLTLATIASVSLLGLPITRAAIDTWLGHGTNVTVATGFDATPADGDPLVSRPAGAEVTTAANDGPLAVSAANTGGIGSRASASGGTNSRGTLTPGSGGTGAGITNRSSNARTISAPLARTSSRTANVGSANGSQPPAPSASGSNDAFDTNPVVTGGVANFSGNFTVGTTTPAAGGAGTPASGDALYFGTSSTTTLNNDLAAGTVFSGLTFNSGASAFTIGGNAFTLSAGITNNSAANQTINNAITLSADQSWLAGTANGATLTLGGSVTGAGITLTTNGGTGGPLSISANTIFTGAVSLGSLVAQGNANNGPTYSSNPTTTFNGSSTLTTTGNVVVGRSNLVFAGSTTAAIAGSITNAGASSADWANVTIQDTANVTAASVNMNGNGVTGNLSLNGGTLTTGSIAGIDGEGFGGVRLRLNGTQIIAFQSNATFLTVAVSSNSGVAGNATTSAYVGNGGALFNSNGFDIGVTANLNNDSGATGFLTKSGSGTLALSGANTYTGATTISGGTLQLGNGGTTGSLSTSSAVVDNATFAVNRSNAVTQGTDFSGAAIAGTGGFTQAGTGTTTLAAANTFTGPTVVNAGTLNLTGSITSPVNVNSGGTLSGFGNGTSTGKIMGNVTVAGGGALSLAAGTSSVSLTIGGALTLGGTGSYGTGQYSTLNYTLSANGVEALNASGALTLNSGGAYISLNGTTASGTYNLLSFSSQTGSGAFSLSSTAPGVTSEMLGQIQFTLVESGTLLQLQVSNQAVVPGVAYFDGAVSSRFSDVSSVTNFSTNLAGTTDAGTLPGSTTDVILNASNATTNRGATTLSETLGSSTAINSLRINGNGTTTLAADGSTLTINALQDSNTASDGSFSGNAAGTGISIASGANAFTLGVPVVLGNSQTWTNNSASLFTVSGTSVTGSAITGASQTLTLANTGAGGTTISAVIGDGSGGGKLALAINNSGTGTTTLSGANTYTGGTTISGGTVVATGATSLGPNAAATTVSIGSGATLNLQSPTDDFVYSETFSGSGLVKLTSTANGGTTINNFGVFSGTIEVALTGNNKFLIRPNIPTNLSSATLLIDNNSQYFSIANVNFGTINVQGGGNFEGRGAIRLNGNGTTTGILGGNVFLQGNTTIGSEGGTLTGNISPAVAGTTTLTMGTGNSNGTALLSGVLSDGTGQLALSQAAGTTTLSNANTYTGVTTITGGSLKLTNALAVQNSTVTNNVANGVVFDASVTGNAFTFGALAGTANLALQNNAATPAPVALTVGASSGTYSGVLSGAGSLTQNGPGTQTLSGANTYTGVTTISGGTLQMGSASALPAAALVGGSGLIINTGGTLDLNGNSITLPSIPNGTGGAITNTGAGASTLTFGSGGTLAQSVNGNTALTLTGGTLATNVTNTYTGATTISGGTLTLMKAGSAPDPNNGYLTTGGTLAGTSGFTINTGGTLVLGASNSVGSGPTTSGQGLGTGVTLSGGMLMAAGGITQGQGRNVTVGMGDPNAFDVPGLGNLTLTATSSLTFAGASGTLVFTGLTLNDNALSIGGTHFATLLGNSADGTTDRLIVENDAGPLSPTDLARITFANYGNSVATEIDLGDSFYEIIPLYPVVSVPEPSTWAALLLGLGALCYRQRSRVSRLIWHRSR